MIAVINYGLGNLHSVQKAVANVGGAAVVTDDAQEIMGADKVVLPGVGAFADGMAQGKPLLGICLGMQLLFEESEEQGHHLGLGLLAGKVVLFQDPGVKVPQIGWNQVQIDKQSDLISGINDGEYFYFNHGYYCIPGETRDVLTRTDYGTSFASAVERETIFGVQFHPEKSQHSGLLILKNFVEL
jgi:glutamine amidotransferase